MQSGKGYTAIQIAVHWLTALLILASFIISDDVESAAAGRGGPLHVWLGYAVLALIAIRLIVNGVQGKPGHIPGQSPLMQAAAIWGQRLLYLLMIAAPLTGVATWYGFDPAEDLHEGTSNLLMIVALGHAAAALWHQYILRDGALTRMLRSKA